MEKFLEKDFSDSLFSKIKRSFLIIYFSIPVMISNIGSMSIMTINTYYAGHMGDVAILAAIGVANSWINFVGLGPLISFNLGFFALASQVNGTGIEGDLKIICQRGLIFNLILYGISTILLLGSPIILSLLGVEEHIITILTPYTYAYIICLFSDIFVDMMKNLLNAQKMFSIYPVSSIIVTLIHCIQCEIFIRLGFGLISLSISKLLVNIYLIIIMVSYMKYYKINGFLIESFDKKAKGHLIDYTKNVVPSGIITYIEWMAFEFTTIIASNYDDVVLSAHTVFMNIMGLNYCFFLGIGILYASLLGNALGMQDRKTAQVLKDTFATLIVVLMVIYLIYIKLSFEWVVGFMTDKEDVHQALMKIVIITYTLCCFDFYQGIVANTLRAVGQQNYAAVIYIFSYYAIGTPLSLIFGVMLNLTILGWFGAMYFSQGIFCFLCHRKFNYLKIDEIMKNIEENIESQFSQRSFHNIYADSQLSHQLHVVVKA